MQAKEYHISLYRKYLNLSGPRENISSLTVGRRLRVAALIIATNVISNSKPVNEIVVG